MLKFDRDIYLQNLKLKAEAALDSGLFGKQYNRSLKQDIMIYQTELEIQNDEMSKLQTELLEAKSELLSLYNTSPVGRVTLNKHGFIKRANLTFTKCLGLKPCDVMGRVIFDFIHIDEQETFKSDFAEFFEKPTNQNLKTRLSSKVFTTEVVIKGKKDIPQDNGALQDETIDIAIMDISDFI